MFGDHETPVGRRDDGYQLKLLRHSGGIVRVNGGVEADAVACLLQGISAPADFITVGEFLTDGGSGGLRILGQIFYLEVVFRCVGIIT